MTNCSCNNTNNSSTSNNCKPLGETLTHGNKTKEAVCINVDKVYDACRERHCLEDLPVIVCSRCQSIIDNAINVKVKSAEVIWVFTDIEPVPFNRGYFSVDTKYFFNVMLEVFTGSGRPVQVEGLCTFDTKVILFGSEGNSKSFSSKNNPGSDMPLIWQKNNLPKAVVEVVEPIALNAKLVETCNCCMPGCDVQGIPDCICRCFEDDLALCCHEGEKRVFVTLGLFAITRIERNVQLLMPAFDFCIPTKECDASTDDNPCGLFETLRFPVDEFFPPEKSSFDCQEAPLSDRVHHHEHEVSCRH